MLLADYQDYIDCQQRVGEVFADSERWTRMSILNVARIGKFSSDRSIKEYSEKIWQVSPFPVQLKWPRIPEDGVLLKMDQEKNVSL
jgi:starch phosphorylase